MRMTRQISEFGPSAGLSIMTSFSSQFDPTVAVEADSAAEGSWDAEASVVLPLRFLGG